ncbi:hypothetical protein AB0G74_30485 [Streptomyces sp. NPDC020875]|uniref:hypothetical protein n=1 Tax=Streptomyces sp. NPDC020875 TaxID=3154898 RepID=UPI0033F3606F
MASQGWDGLGESERIALGIVAGIERERRPVRGAGEPYAVDLTEAAARALERGIDLLEIDAFVVGELEGRGLIGRVVSDGRVLLRTTPVGRDLVPADSAEGTSAGRPGPKAPAAERDRLIWDGLHDAERALLEQVFGADQEQHAANQRRFREGGRSLPARQARRVLLGDGTDTAALAVLVKAGLAEAEEGGGTAAGVWMTRRGRAVVRAGKGLTAKRPVPAAGAARAAGPGEDDGPATLTQGLWTALATVARAGDDGADYLFHGILRYLLEGRSKERPYLRRVSAVLPAAEPKPEPEPEADALFGLGELAAGATAPSARAGKNPGGRGQRVTRYRFTEAGRAYYRQTLAAHRALYPGVDAPDLPPDG